MVMEVVHEDIDDGNLQCTNHPYKNITPGGICPVCLQEKLGNLIVSSSSPSSTFPLANAIKPSSSSSSTSPSFRSDFGGSITTSASASASGNSTLHVRRHLASLSSNSQTGSNDFYTRRSRLPFVLTHKKKNVKDGVANINMVSSDSTNIVFKRSKSTKTPRRGMNFSDDNENYIVEDHNSPYKRGFWSFLLYLSKSSKKNDKHYKDSNFVSASASTVGSSSVNGSSAAVIRSREKKRDDDFVMVEENDDEPPFDKRKVSRSRSIGCGSRSFSGDFFEKISSGFGDCTLRRVESQREGRPYKVQSQSGNNGSNSSRNSNGQDCIKERVKCGGIFSGFMITSSSASSSSAEDNNINVNGKSISGSSTLRHLSHGRSKSWGWAFASPMRAFSNKHSTGKRGATSNKNVTPNLAAIPSLLAEK
ncbi:hypothetical protein ACJIZ3_018151 [Penstemon smallii]|uniref:Uncharacterized protein n=1 Tax=Penstemon smallii TaxID=265156 RepID=A0ABD3SXJ3_9LAMI